jgi:RimJ/RimL family protein N-acetyltransferase
MYREAVAGVSPRSRYLRFAAPIPRLSESLLDRMMDSDGVYHVVCIATPPDERSIVGVARFTRSHERPRSAEIAIAVAGAWQASGLGSVLLARLVALARQTDLSLLTAFTLSENVAARRLARSAGFSLAATDSLYTEYQLELARSRPCKR